MNISKKIIAVLLIIAMCSGVLLLLGKEVFGTQRYTNDINNINNYKYPGYKETIQALQSAHPNWKFKILYTGIDWNEAIANEYFHTSGDYSPRNLVEEGDTSHDQAWICPVCGTSRKYDSGRWYCASEAAIAYMMDPRNSLNASDIFQFEELTYNASTQTASGVTQMSNPTFLARESGIVNSILNGASRWNMNAYFIAARLKQEQGKGGSTVSGTYPGYEGYYNAFNISASGNSSTTVISNALAYAKAMGWTSIGKSIEGGMEFLKNQYINKGQNTLYLQKFDVEEQYGLYFHQYMQNLMAAQNEGVSMRKAYGSNTESTHTFIIPIYENMPVSSCPRPKSTSSEFKSNGFGVKYSSHVQDLGWETMWPADGVTSGTTGQNKKVEAMKIELLNAPSGASIKYSAYVDGIGWQNEVRNGATAGTTGQNRRMFAMKMSLENANGYSIMYRAHVQDRGWLSWVKDGAVTGYTNAALKIEAIQIKIVKNTNNMQLEPHVEYISHVQDLGWETTWNGSGIQSGTTGQNKKVEALKISLLDAPSNMKLKYSTYVEGIGWQQEVETGQVSGTTGQNKRIFGLKIRLENTTEYSVQYRVHIQNRGWLNWTSNGSIAGDINNQLKIEAFEVKIIKGNVDPTPSEDEPQQEMKVEYMSHVQDLGWEKSWITDGKQSGTTGKNKKVEAMKIRLKNATSGVNINYRAYVEGIGWQNAVKNGEITGTTGQNKKMYAIRISLENTNNYSVAYRVHLQDIGWMDWVYDGSIAGNVASFRKIEAIEIKLVEKRTESIGVDYKSHVQDLGWEKSWITNGAQSGTVGQNKKIEAMQIRLKNVPAKMSINYSTYVEGIGWTTAKDGTIGGTIGQNKKIFGIKINLENANNYTVKYRVQVQDRGWLDWVSDGELAGLNNLSKKIEAIEIKLVEKN